MIEVLGYTFMQRALIAGLLVAVLCSAVGMFVVLKRLAFIGVGVSHASFGGVAIGFFLGIDPLLSALVFSTGMAVLIGWMSRTGRMSEDSAIGIMFSVSMALGVLLVGLTTGYTVDLFGYLFGNILSVTSEDLLYTLALSAIVLGCVGAFYHQLVYLSFDEEGARASGVPVGALYYMLLVLIALTVVVAIKVVGIVLVSALLIIPAASSLQVLGRLRSCMIAATGLGIFSVLSGLVGSYYFDLATGGTIVLVCGLLFALSFAIGRMR
ncbi:metal ABC transporter permease [Methermicoccus shengliensis]|uniref:metal ABC transporter permease n=1 Tax=Methermicoccus shengliensis TaxID=660064 RepID=UPI0005B2B4A5|nr:metal ABC transporter permease [Methermicoccus shengliensis]KUK05059.1 MAG: ABC-3 protein [Euryarchaeota archaeon 55_53]KUK30352.1 MAG: ABC-3 protein [Methanosarcinales archeaon 56_1174]MDI3487557.1 zinc transport system permease protein [Methanosarcinales archaeon]MDN5294706.1 zinc transport system permease protein [Methanosarcinales archaeon]